ncbi:hypothetical protein F2Q68_00011266 [Brassica cretica]|uniref:Uncharacterized protein n=1 Tax=Brassica cretica TaxID=69181 RepID=A0A8S9KT82_BRACR|nr:hypothetical protein F2Q68_00011266 [Brassica cretica]
MKWIVGDGEHINVRKDNWLHSQPPSPAQGRGTETHPHIRVKDLFHPGTKEWNVQLINDLVRQEDAKYILNIRPPISRRPDVLVWNYTRTWNTVLRLGTIFGETSQQWKQETKKQVRLYLKKSGSVVHRSGLWMLHGSLLERRWGLAGPYTEEKAPKSCMDPQHKRL